MIISKVKNVSFQFPLENLNVGGFPDFKRDGDPKFRYKGFGRSKIRSWICSKEDEISSRIKNPFLDSPKGTHTPAHGKSIKFVRNA